MKKTMTNFLNAAVVMLCLFCFSSLQAQPQNAPSRVGSKASLHASERNVTPTFNRVQPISLLRGNIAYGFSVYDDDATYPAYVSFDVDAPQTPTQINTASLSDIACAEFYHGTVYGYDQSANFYTIDPETGVATLVSTQNQYFQDMAFDYSTQTMYGISSTGLYTIDLTTGVFTLVGTTGMTGTPMTLACDTDGNMFTIENGTTGNFYSVDKTTGTATLIAATNVDCSYLQSMGFDHNTGTLYWANCNSADGKLYTIDPATGAATEIGLIGANIELIGFFVPYYDIAIANAPTNFTVTPGTNYALTATLDWTNPTTTFLNTPLTSIDSIIIKRNGVGIHRINNPGVGATMQWVDNTISVAGIYNYTIYAVANGGNGIATSASAEIGQLCDIKIIGVDSYGDGWNGAAIQVLNSGTVIGTATVSTGTSEETIIRCPIASLDFAWVEGSYDSECSFTITDGYDIPIMVSDSAPVEGIFFTYNNTCAPPVSYIVSGTVTALSNNAPIQNATIAFAGTQGQTVTSDATGYYSAPVVDGFYYTVTVSAAGYNTIVLDSLMTNADMTQNFQMTAPIINITAPNTVEVWTNYTIDGHYTPITITNNGNGTLTWGNSITYLRSRGEVESNPINYTIRPSNNQIVSRTADVAPTIGRIVGEPTRATWDLLSNFTMSAAGEQGICTDGDFIYSAFWGTAGQFGKYDLQGNFIETFTIAGVGGIRDLTYDGTYFYGGATGSDLYQMDFNARTLVSTIATSVSAIRHCSYDSDNDGFWVGNWTDLYLINRAGAIVITGPTVADVYGSAYDKYSAGGPYLWLFTQAQGQTTAAVFQQLNIGTMAITNITHDASDIPGATSDGSAGGCFGTDLLIPGQYVIMANLQETPNAVGIYEIAPAGWLTLSPASGSLEPGESDTVTMNMDGWWAVSGDFAATCTFTTTNPNVGSYDVPVIFHIAPPACDAPTNLQVIPTDYDYMHLSWDAPADTTGLVEYRIYYGGNQTHFATSDTTSYDDNVNAGQYCYTVRAYYSDSCLTLPTDTVCAELLPCDPDSACSIRFEMTDQYSDSWNGAKIEVYLDGVLINTITNTNGVSPESVNISVCNGQVTFVWVAGGYDSECSFVIYNAANEVIYNGSTAPAAGQFAAYTQDCGHVGISENEAAHNVNIFPNPVSDVLNVSAPGFKEFDVINFLGQVVYSNTITSEQTTINVSNLTNGIYFIRLKADNKVETMKFIKR